MDTDIDQPQQEQERLVAQWLLSTAGFFDRHPDLLAQIELANSHSGKAISLQEKQMALLRNQNRDLNQRLSEMLRFGTENDRTQTLMVKWLEGLLASKDRNATIESITTGLNKLFDIGNVEIISPEQVSEELKTKLDLAPICGSVDLVTNLVSSDLLLDASSMVVIPLMYQGTNLGALFMASQDKEKFSPQMGLSYIHQLAQLAAAALYRFQGQ
ncbi:hypothetical protein PSHI8_23160 [Polynucleobacter sp. SHI8]|uniref:DUF484 family protein n=1 Tax=unclassified Polynucleobacter TaxID=2640945 RepID=UPI0024929A91|nr:MULTISPECIES: DUF484 family protein [unclassified Polynucleobacter]BDW12232.1 hypothetical protein PSHI2_23140 [Polynucleobacter sp. SHI2]BDW14680.1 hypothetical protein PSHI8_23160 [Polynucleobacter sp. SHI8]